MGKFWINDKLHIVDDEVSDELDRLASHNRIAIEALEQIWTHASNEQSGIAATALNRIKPIAPALEELEHD